jgi:hypothetical protein
MKFTTTLSVIALAGAAAATPVEIEARTGGGGGGGNTPTCDSNQHQVCCASVIGVQCLIDILGGNCNGGTYCCNAGGASVSYHPFLTYSTRDFINLFILGCLD